MSHGSCGCLILMFVLSQAFGRCPRGKFGFECQLQCKCRNSSKDCDGVCETCARGYSSYPTCQRENVALDKPVVGSGNNSYEAVVDGDVTSGTMGYARTGQTTRWIAIDLQFRYRVKWLRLKTSDTNLCGIVIWLSNKSVAANLTFSRMSSVRCWSMPASTRRGQQYDITCDKPARTRYVIASCEGRQVMSVNEVEIFYCTPHTYGPGCTKQCNCYYRTDECDSVTGACLRGCAPGFMGRNCTTPCPFDKFGVDCARKCNCHIGFICDHKQGTCESDRCDVRHIAENHRCQLTCSNWTYGYPSCLGKCRCRDNTQCDVRTGFCHDQVCQNHRWTGTSCQRTCTEGRFFVNGVCSGFCACANSSLCSVFDGTCKGGICKIGFRGPRCDMRCVPGTFGENCSKKCHCASSDQCDAVTGYCSNGCAPGWEGHYCQKCQATRWGNACRSVCYCANSERCTENGFCRNGCRQEYGGISCNLTCATGRFVLNSMCQGRCNCRLCRVNDGKCQSPCYAGWVGSKCQTRCSEGTFGTNCTGTCNCKNDSQCHPDTGVCTLGCSEGYAGYSCQHCEAGRFGRGCYQFCHCKNNSTCHELSGKCDLGCDDKYTGPSCQERVTINKIRTIVNMTQIIAIASATGGIVLIIGILFLFFSTTAVRGRESTASFTDYQFKRIKRDLGEEHTDWVELGHDLVPITDSLARGVVNEACVNAGNDKRSDGDAIGFSDETKDGAKIQDRPTRDDTLGTGDRPDGKHNVVTLPYLNKPMPKEMEVLPYRQPEYEEPLEYGGMELDDDLRDLFKDPTMKITTADVDFSTPSDIAIVAHNGTVHHTKRSKHVSMGNVCKIPARIKPYGGLDKSRDEPRKTLKLSTPHFMRRFSSAHLAKKSDPVPEIKISPVPACEDKPVSFKKSSKKKSKTEKDPKKKTAPKEISIDESTKDSAKESTERDRSNSKPRDTYTRSHLLTHPDERDPDDPSLVKNWSSTSQNSFLQGWNI